MNNKNVSLGNTARTKLRKGINVLAEAVGSTLGPAGKSVVIQNLKGFPQVTKDGVSVAEAIKLKDPEENLGVDLIKQAAQKTASLAGDGTTTSTVMTAKMINAAEDVIKKHGYNTTAFKIGMNIAKDLYLKRLQEHSIEVEEDQQIKDIAIISCNNDKELGSIVSEAMLSVGAAGSVNVLDSPNNETYQELVPGMKLDRRGWMSPYLVNNEIKHTVELDNPLIYVSGQPIEYDEEVIPLMGIAKKENRSIVFIGQAIKGQALQSIITNASRGVVKATCVVAPMFGELQSKVLEDIAILTGTKVNHTIVNDIKSEHWKLGDFGECEKFEQTYEDSVIMDGYGDDEEIDARLTALQLELDAAESQQLKDFTKERMGKLSNGIVQLFVGGMGESEIKEKKDRIEDALYATKAALEEGVIPGGGATNLRIGAQVLLDGNEYVELENPAVKAGFQVVLDALIEPMILMLGHSLIDNDKTEIHKVLDKVLASDKEDTFNIFTQKYGNAISMGVIDPTRVARVSLETAVSVAGVVISTNCIISEQI